MSRYALQTAGVFDAATFVWDFSHVCQLLQLYLQLALATTHIAQRAGQVKGALLHVRPTERCSQTCAHVLLLNVWAAF